MILRLLVVLFTTVVMAGDAPGKLRGGSVLNDIVQERIFNDLDYYDFDKVLGDYSLVELLGYYSDEGVFTNGTPNSTNTLLWTTLTTSLTKSIAEVCDKGANASVYKYLRDDYRITLEKVCKWPAVDSATLDAFWIYNMDYDAPETELNEWKSFSQSSENLSKKPSEVVQTLLMAMFLNPYFLIQR